MRWKDTPKPYPGEERTIKRFLWRSLCLDREWRWFEFANIVQVYSYERNGSGREWRDKCWGLELPTISDTEY